MSQFRNNDYLSGSNAIFLEELYGKYLQNPSSVSESWQDYFASLNEGGTDVKMSLKGAPWKPKQDGFKKEEEIQASPAKKSEDLQGQSALLVSKIIEAYRRYGHTKVDLDPLEITPIKPVKDMDLSIYGLNDEILQNGVKLTGSKLVDEGQSATIGDIINTLEKVYSSRIGFEFEHLENFEEREWLQAKVEATRGDFQVSNHEKRRSLTDLIQVESFEQFLHTKFPGTKRFSIEGGEALIVALEVAIEQSVAFGAREAILGMAHRGRLNTLTKVMGKPYHAILSEFKGGLAFPEDLDVSGDVKYHLGTSSDREIEGKQLHLSLTPNPSHLEVVNSVVLGKMRAKQQQYGGTDYVTGMLVHGDSALAGQGSVIESLSLSQLEGYHVGGVIHLVVNNQIGFTTAPESARATRYCTDVAKAVDSPVFHVCGDDIESVVYVTKLAAEYKQKFKKDVFIDIVCYRKYGHNEGDEPLFTQPMMYKKIASHPTPATIYSNKLMAEGVITEQEYEQETAKFKELLESEFEKSQGYKPTKADWLAGKWGGLQKANWEEDKAETGVKEETLKELGAKLSSVPENFNLNSKVARQLKARKQMLETGEKLDWGTGEALAFATLLNEGYLVRVSGQDSERGTFSHRHAALIDQATEEKYIPLNNLGSDQKAFLDIHNSNLSEFAVLGFEYGYSFTEPNALSIWEAQFGDFANGAQVIIDQYVTSGEEKWLRMSGLVMLLPHGYEGQGPEHSSARLERFLQLAAKGNIQVANCTTPASFFHILRRQLHRKFRKPLIVMTPKSLLRHRLAVSNLKDMAEGTRFLPVLSDNHPEINSKGVSKIVFCSGKIYYDLYQKREELKRFDIVLIRLEQLYPFPRTEILEELQKYPKDAEIIWCQEEHKNMGAYYFFDARMYPLLEGAGMPKPKVRYIGRKRAASPAVGYMKLHQAEHNEILEELFN